MKSLRVARALAKLAHLGQVDKVGNPYFEHAERVAETARKLALEAKLPLADVKTITVIGFLHDVIEDTNATLEDLERFGFSQEVISGVEAMTHLKGIPYADYVKEAAKNPYARWVKLADIIDHLTRRDWAMPKEYRTKYVAALRLLVLACYGSEVVIV